jgi:hypothetical protein
LVQKLEQQGLLSEDAQYLQLLLVIAGMRQLQARKHGLELQELVSQCVRH